MQLAWNEQLATGIEEIDGLQFELFRRATQLVDAARGCRASEVRAHLVRLTEVAELLFDSEEQALRDAGARSLIRHAMEHRRFLADLSVVTEELGRRGSEVFEDLEVATHVTRWLDQHVGHTDRDLGRLPRQTAEA